jgi:integrase
MTIKTLDRATVATLTALPDGKTGELYWDTKLKGFGLRVRLDAGGTIRRSYIVQYRVGKQQRKQKIGDASKINVDQARSKAEKLFAKITLGIDPAAEREAERAATALTFSAAVEQYLDLKKLKVRNSSLRLSTLYLTGTRYFGTLHRTSLTKITQSQVSARLDAIYVDSGAPTASQARKHLSAFFVWCLKRGHCLLNPVVNTEAVKLGPGRERVLRDDELCAVWNACKDDDLGRIVKLLVLTGCRCREIGGLRWSEIDLEQNTLTIPGARTKNGRELTLPITGIMRSIIEAIPQRLNRDHLFGDRADGFTSWAKQQHLGDGLTERWTLHDLRRSAATHMAEIGIQPHIIEAILNHVSGHKAGVAGIYNRATYAREMKNALAVWSDHVASIVTGSEQKVVNFPTYKHPS